MPLDTPRLPIRHRAARPPLDAVREPAAGELSHAAAANYLGDRRRRPPAPTSISGCIPRQAGFDIFENNLGDRSCAGRDAAGERIRIEGRVLDGTGAPVRDVLIEIWQANAAGRYATRPIASAGRRRRRLPRLGPRRDGLRDRAVIASRRSSPARSPGRNGHGRWRRTSTLWIVARGINIGLITRLYFGDEAEANAEDPVLGLIEQPARRATLVAARNCATAWPVYGFDIRLQGEGETVFFDI